MFGDLQMLALGEQQAYFSAPGYRGSRELKERGGFILY
jgi:hypothetical protein